MKNKIELLAPAGDLEKLKIDVLYGADAIYIGGKSFSLRSASNNFSFDEMKEGVEFAHRYHKKVYVAFNVYPNDYDLKRIDDYLIELNQIGIDAIIVSSLYIMKRANDLKCNFEIHVSTQDSSANIKAIEFFKDYNATRVVLAREASLDEIKDIMDKTNLEIEVFIHGAMCCSYSGRCTLSNYYTNRDANKGCCSHPCRWDYDLFNSEKRIFENEKFLLGSKDLMSINYIKDLINCGVSSLKIEGRMKSINYLAHVVKTYRKLIDDIYSNKILDMESYLKELDQTGNRQTTFAWLKGYTDENDLIYTFENTPLQNYLGMILEYDKENHLALVETKNIIRKNEEVELISFDHSVKSFIVKKLIDPNGLEVDIANNTFFNYKIEIDFDVEKYQILRRKL